MFRIFKSTSSLNFKMTESKSKGSKNDKNKSKQTQSLLIVKTFAEASGVAPINDLTAQTLIENLKQRLLFVIQVSSTDLINFHQLNFFFNVFIYFRALKSLQIIEKVKNSIAWMLKKCSRCDFKFFTSKFL